MSDLVGNPEDRFSRVAAHINIVFCFHVCTGFFPPIKKFTAMPEHFKSIIKISLLIVASMSLQFSLLH